VLIRLWGEPTARHAYEISVGRQSLRRVAGIVGVITAVLAGATAGLVVIAASGHSLTAALISSVVVALTAMTVLMRFQVRA
jgi:hypothetical protein